MLRAIVMTVLLSGAALANEMGEPDWSDMQRPCGYLEKKRPRGSNPTWDRTIDNCEAMAAQQRPQAEQRAARLAEEARARDAKVAADREHEAQLDIVRADAKRMSAVLGAVVCTRAVKRKFILAAIAREKRDARIAGVINLRKLQDYKEMLQSLDDDEKQERAALVNRRELKVAACSDKTVKAILKCRDENVCAEDWHRVALEMIPETPSEVE